MSLLFAAMSPDPGKSKRQKSDLRHQFVTELWEWFQEDEQGWGFTSSVEAIELESDNEMPTISGEKILDLFVDHCCAIAGHA
ncbi:MAG: hypothetical protein AAGH89_12240, partial [Verrucomicrobiota bacterium]